MKFKVIITLALAIWAGALHAATIIRIGVASGPQAEVLEIVQKLASANSQIQIELVPFTKTPQINTALRRGQIEAASFEDGVALADNIQQQGDTIAPAAQTITLPLGFYSKRIHHLNSLQAGATIVVPQERHEQARALLLLHNYGLIGLRDKAGTKARLSDISYNPRKFRIRAVASQQLFAQLEKADLVVMDFDTASAHNLAPARDGIGMEDARSPYAGVLTVRSADKNAPWLTELLHVYRSEPVKQFILTHYQDSVRRPW